MSNNIYRYYVYAYLRLDRTPYYIGKGKGNRAFDQRHSIKLPKDESRIVFLERNLSNIGACALERRYIRWSDEARKKVSIMRRGVPSGRKMTAEHIRKITDGRKRQVLEKRLSLEKLQMRSMNSNHD